MEGFVKALEVIADDRVSKPRRKRQLNFDLEEGSRPQQENFSRRCCRMSLMSGAFSGMK